MRAVAPRLLLLLLLALFGSARSAATDPAFFAAWPTSVEQWNAFLDQQLAAHPTVARSFTYPQLTYQGRSIRGVRVSSAPADSAVPVVWLQGMLHPGEWIAGMSTAYVLHRLLQQHAAGDVTARELLAQVAFDVVPMANPDGYAYTLTDPANDDVRHWRKTLTPNANSSCVGTNLNRNFPVGWATTGSSPDPCDSEFHGSAPLSDPTSAASAMHGASIRERLLWFADIHCCVPSWTSAWGYTTDLPPNYPYLLSFMQTASAAIRSVHGTVFEVGTAARVIGLGGGGADEFAFSALATPLSFTVEMRDQFDGDNATQIVPSGQEIYAGIVAATQRALSDRQPPANPVVAVAVLAVCCGLLASAVLALLVYVYRMRTHEYARV